jgi:hypothetical protein
MRAAAADRAVKNTLKGELAPTFRAPRHWSTVLVADCEFVQALQATTAAPYSYKYDKTTASS